MEKTTIEKKTKIMDLLLIVSDELINKFFDLESNSLLDEKIEVLTALKKGEKPFEISKYYDILELMPTDGQIWD